jgi:hypothetical protein
MNPAPLSDRVTGRRLQHEAVRLCRQLPSCLAGPLGELDVIVALSIPASVRGKQRSRRFAALVQRLQRLLLRTVQLPTIAGLGSEVVPGAGLGAGLAIVTAILAEHGDTFVFLGARGSGPVRFGER